MRMSGSTAPRSNWGCAKRWRFPGTSLIWPASTGPTTRSRTAAAEGPAKPARRTKVTKVLHELLRATVKFLSVKSISEMLVQNKSMGRPEPSRDRKGAEGRITQTDLPNRQFPGFDRSEERRVGK